MSTDTPQAVPLWQNSVYWIGSRTPKAFLQSNTYAVFANEKLFIIDPGPTARWPSIQSALTMLLQEKKLDCNSVSWCIVLTGLEAASSVESGAALQPLAGCGPPPERVIGHWKVSLQLQNDIPFTPVSSYSSSIPLSENRSLQMLSVLPGERSGNIMLRDSLSGVLFSGPVFSSMGPGSHTANDSSPMLFSGKPAARQLGAMQHFHQQLGDARWIQHVLQAEHPLWDASVSMVLPRYGLLHESETSSLLTSLHMRIATLPESMSEPNLGTKQSVEELLEEINSLQRNAFEMQEHLVMAQDERIRDAATGLYNHRFFQEYLPLFMQEHPDNAAMIMAYLDDLVDVNQQQGSREGDLSIARFAKILSAAKPDSGMLFRLSGPLCCLLLPSSSLDEARSLAKTIRQAVREDQGFTRRMTCSLSATATDEQLEAHQLINIAENRLRYARRQGGDLVCSFIPDDDAVHPGDNIRILLLETDELTAELIHSYLESHGCSCMISSDGMTAVAAMHSFQPHVIAAELFLHGVDPMRLREQALADSTIQAIPWVLYSHQKNQAVIERAHRLGMYHFLKKPIVLRELLGIIRKLSDRKLPV